MALLGMMPFALHRSLSISSLESHFVWHNSKAFLSEKVVISAKRLEERMNQTQLKPESSSVLTSGDKK